MKNFHTLVEDARQEVDRDEARKRLRQNDELAGHVSLICELQDEIAYHYSAPLRNVLTTWLFVAILLFVYWLLTESQSYYPPRDVNWSMVSCVFLIVALGGLVSWFRHASKRSEATRCLGSCLGSNEPLMREALCIVRVLDPDRAPILEAKRMFNFLSDSQ